MASIHTTVLAGGIEVKVDVTSSLIEVVVSTADQHNLGTFRVLLNGEEIEEQAAEGVEVTPNDIVVVQPYNQAA